MDNFAHSMQAAGQTKKIIISALLLLFLPALVLVANMQTGDRRIGAAGDASLSIVPRGITLTAGRWVVPANQDVDFDVKLTTVSNEAIAFSMQVDYDPTVLQLVQAPDPDTGVDPNFTCAALPNIINKLWVQRVDPLAPSAEGRVTLVCHILTTNQVGTTPIYKTASSAPAGAKVAFPLNTTMNVAALKFRTLKQTTNSFIRFDTTGNTGIIGWQECHQTFTTACNQNDTRNNILQTANNLTFDVAAPAGATFTIDPVTTKTYLPSATTDRFPVTVKLSTGGQSVSGADLELRYDPTKLNVITGGAVGGTAFPNYPSNGISINNTTGSVRISGLVNAPGTTPTPGGSGITGTNLAFATITFEPIATATSTQISVYYNAADSRNDSNIVLYGTSTDLLTSQPNPVAFAINTAATPTPTRTPTPAVSTATPTRTPTPAVSTATPTRTPTPVPPTATPTTAANIGVTLKINLQGRAWAPNNMARTVVLNIFGGVNSLTGFRESVTSSPTGDIALTIPAGTYNILIKPVGYLNRRFTSTVSTTNTVFDFSSEANAIRAGDINKVSTGVYGDKIINAFDYTALLTNFKAEGTTNADVVAADLDGSGQVNSLDFSLILSNWGNCDVKADGTMDNPTPQVCANF